MFSRRHFFGSCLAGLAGACGLKPRAAAAGPIDRDIYIASIDLANFVHWKKKKLSDVRGGDIVMRPGETDVDIVWRAMDDAAIENGQWTALAHSFDPDRIGEYLSHRTHHRFIASG